MTASLQPETKSTSRRVLLAGALGGIGAWAASAIGRASLVRAGVDGDVVLGGANSATTNTGITNSSNGNEVFTVHSNSGVGVRGTSDSNIGVLAISTSYIGVSGDSTSYIGVYGSSNATNQPAVVGQSVSNSTGMLGYSGGSLPAAKAKTGVFGYAAQDSASVGVRGESPAGFGVYGKTTGTGFAGYFNGKVYMTQFLEMGEIAAAPATPAANKARLFLKDNGLGKTQLIVKFANGSVKVLATET